MTKQTHIHKLRRHRHKTGNTIFFCTLPDCSYKINNALALGKRSICWRCGAEFILSEYALRLAKPHCEACHKPKNDNAPAISDRMTVAEEAPARATISLIDQLNRALGKVHEAEEDI